MQGRQGPENEAAYMLMTEQKNTMVHLHGQGSQHSLLDASDRHRVCVCVGVCVCVRVCVGVCVCVRARSDKIRKSFAFVKRAWFNSSHNRVFKSFQFGHTRCNAGTTKH